MTEFSARSDESDIGANDNILDFRLQNIEYGRDVYKLFGLHDDEYDQNIKTFVTLDFFVNETQNTDVKEGANPDFDTIFCFKNQVDNFYIKFLKDDYILAEVYAVRRGMKKSTIKIGEAKLPLSFLLDND